MREYSSSELYHYRMGGEKTGVRRYQNYDGSLTPLGRIHYGVGPARDGSGREEMSSRGKAKYDRDRVKLALKRKKQQDKDDKKALPDRKKLIDSYGINSNGLSQDDVKKLATKIGQLDADGKTKEQISAILKRSYSAKIKAAEEDSKASGADFDGDKPANTSNQVADAQNRGASDEEIKKHVDNAIKSLMDQQRAQQNQNNQPKQPQPQQNQQPQQKQDSPEEQARKYLIDRASIDEVYANRDMLSGNDINSALNRIQNQERLAKAYNDAHAEAPKKTAWDKLDALSKRAQQVSGYINTASNLYDNVNKAVKLAKSFDPKSKEAEAFKKELIERADVNKIRENRDKLSSDELNQALNRLDREKKLAEWGVDKSQNQNQNNGGNQQKQQTKTESADSGSTETPKKEKKGLFGLGGKSEAAGKEAVKASGADFDGAKKEEKPKADVGAAANSLKEALRKETERIGGDSKNPANVAKTLGSAIKTLAGRSYAAGTLGKTINEQLNGGPSQSEINKIKAQIRSGEKTQAEIAKAVGVSTSFVSDVASSIGGGARYLLGAGTNAAITAAMSQPFPTVSASSSQPKTEQYEHARDAISKYSSYSFQSALGGSSNSSSTTKYSDDELRKLLNGRNARLRSKQRGTGSGFWSAFDEEEYLEHHGVKEQKHGVRRYQNYDGSLTPLGRIHYGIGAGRRYHDSHGNLTERGEKRLNADKKKEIARSDKRYYSKANKRYSKMLNAIGDKLSSGKVPDSQISKYRSKYLTASTKNAFSLLMGQEERNRILSYSSNEMTEERMAVGKARVAAIGASLASISLATVLKLPTYAVVLPNTDKVKTEMRVSKERQAELMAKAAERGKESLDLLDYRMNYQKGNLPDNPNDRLNDLRKYVKSTDAGRIGDDPVRDRALSDLTSAVKEKYNSLAKQKKLRDDEREFDENRRQRNDANAEFLNGDYDDYVNMLKAGNRVQDFIDRGRGIEASVSSKVLSELGYDDTPEARELIRPQISELMYERSDEREKKKKTHSK